MIPQEKTTVVARALLEAFGTSQIDDVQKMTRGLSSDLVFRIVVRGSPYLLRIMTRMDETNDPLRVYTCMKAAADAGLAPRVHYTKQVLELQARDRTYWSTIIDEPRMMRREGKLLADGLLVSRLC
jgi:hypothetical protein